MSRAPIRSLWRSHGAPLGVIAKRTWRSLLADNLPSRAAELGFYFFFAMFPILFSASSILGLVARSTAHVYDALLRYLSVVMPASTLSTVLAIFNEAMRSSSPGKFTFGLLIAIWSASIGISAIQDALNGVYKVQETRSYIKARLSAIGVTILVTALMSLSLASMLGTSFFVRLSGQDIHNRFLTICCEVMARVIGWALATAFLLVSFAVIYYWAPAVKTRRWRWISPGAAIGAVGWFLTSLGLRLYIHYFDKYSVIYGSLGAAIILLTWFYITGLMILLGAEINSEIEAAEVQRRLERCPPDPAIG